MAVSEPEKYAEIRINSSRIIRSMPVDISSKKGAPSGIANVSKYWQLYGVSSQAKV